jgi:hypothetical protein
MEEFEKLLTKLTKKSKCDLMSTFEVAISRDYKLKLDELLKGQVHMSYDLSCDRHVTSHRREMMWKLSK